MARMIETYLSGMDLGAPQVFKNMAVFPLLTSLDGGPEYITLKEALEAGVFAVTEVSEGGSVPDLKVENRGGIAVLLLDGEEVAGAKQNRILNTTILVAPKSGLKIPVSCTEHGRWSYSSEKFADSGNVMARTLRSMNMAKVHACLKVEPREFRSDQGAVWEGISHMAEMAEVRSETGAMKDIFEEKRPAFEDYLKNLKLVDGQKGMLVFLEGKAVGFDFVSRPAAFAVLFPKLVKSYAMEAVLSEEGRRKKSGSKDAPSPESARAFLKKAFGCAEEKHESVGLGWYFRYAGKGMVGSALAVEEKIVHMAFFSAEEPEKTGFMAGTGSRRGYRAI